MRFDRDRFQADVAREGAALLNTYVEASPRISFHPTHGDDVFRVMWRSTKGDVALNLYERVIGFERRVDAAAEEQSRIYERSLIDVAVLIDLLYLQRELARGRPGKTRTELDMESAWQRHARAAAEHCIVQAVKRELARRPWPVPLLPWTSPERWLEARPHPTDPNLYITVDVGWGAGSRRTS